MSNNPSHYPMLQINTTKFQQNVQEVTSRCNAAGIAVTGVIKGFNGLTPLSALMRENGCDGLGTSRLEQIEDARQAGIPGPYMLIRIPMISELPRLVALADFSLHSEAAVLDALNEECRRQSKTHQVILMADLGDLREGFWDKDELIEAARHVEQDLKHLHLLGVGTNLGCYGAIRPTVKNLTELIDLAHHIEKVIGRPLELISGGATTSLPLLEDGIMPKEINHLRIGESILLNYDLRMDWGYEMSYIQGDAFTLKAEVIEVKSKPSYPVGDIFIDAFGNTCEYQDKGIRKRALLAIGKLDIHTCEKLIPRLPGIEVLGGSSDHTILDIEDCPADIQAGDILEFDLCYTPLLYLTASRNVCIEYVR